MSCTLQYFSIFTLDEWERNARTWWFLSPLAFNLPNGEDKHDTFQQRQHTNRTLYFKIFSGWMNERGVVLLCDNSSLAFLSTSQKMSPAGEDKLETPRQDKGVMKVAPRVVLCKLLKNHACKLTGANLWWPACLSRGFHRVDLISLPWLSVYTHVLPFPFMSGHPHVAARG